jgi:anti-sigma factor ChrR (cupin superfamily)
LRLNTDTFTRVVVDSARVPWVSSPVSGVQRRLLARNGGESGMATSIVCYAPGAAFASHTHPNGEEFLVLDGALSDEHGTYAAGTYVKNPPRSVHTPRSESGCTLFVKLGQLADEDCARVVVRPTDRQWRNGLVNGLDVVTLTHFGATHTALVRWAPGTFFGKHPHFGGEEIFVLEGTFQDEHGNYPCGTWIRSPHMSSHQPYSERGCLIFVKVGHLL